MCKQCIIKTRPFKSLQIKTLADMKDNERGEICIICDRKFYIKEML